MKRSFGVNTHNGFEGVILIKETGSSSIQQKISNKVQSTTSEINNDNPTKDHSNITKYSNDNTEQHNNETKEQHQTEDKNYRKNENSVIVLGDTIVMHINGCRSAKFM